MKESRIVGTLFCAVLVSIFLFCNPSYAASSAVELKLATHLPPGSELCKVWEDWSRKIEAQTAGRLKITPYYSQSLVKMRDIYVSTAQGIADISHLVVGSEASRFPLTTVADLPLLWPNYKVAVKVMHDLTAKYPEMRAEYGSHLKPFAIQIGRPRIINTCKKPVRTPQELSGMNIIAEGSTARFLKGIKGAPVSISLPDWGMALEKGVAEGVITDYSPLTTFKIESLLPYHTEITLSLMLDIWLINNDKLNSLPPDIKKVLEQNTPQLEEALNEAQANSSAEGKRICEKQSHTFVKISEDEAMLWTTQGQAFQEQWVTDNEASGRKVARQVLEDAKQMAKVYTK